MILILVRHFTLKCGGRVLLNHVSDGPAHTAEKKAKSRSLADRSPLGMTKTETLNGTAEAVLFQTAFVKQV